MWKPVSFARHTKVEVIETSHMTRLGTALNQSSFRLTYVGSDDPIDFNRSINKELLMAVNTMHNSINCMSSEISVFL